MELRQRGDGLLRKAPVAGGPTVTVLFGGDQGGPDVGVVRVDVPPGGAMPEHTHGGSDVVLVPVAGTVVISKGEESITVSTGDAALVRKDEAVSLRNDGTDTAHIVVAAGPAGFVAGIRQWPEPDAAIPVTATDDVERLSVDMCWSLLRTTTIGRLAVVVDDHPDIFPLNYAIDQGTAVFRTGEGSKVLGALSGTPVALEADGYDPETDRAWSVVVKGKARTINEVHDLMDTVDLPLFPWQGGAKSRFIRITPGEVTGRRFAIVDRSTWMTLPPDARRASLE